MTTSQKSLILGTAGHIDHGKTTLVKALTGIDTDRLPAEKQRGITIELGFAHLKNLESETNISIVDVPGHERFIRNMLAGATGFDIAMLVVAADDGVMPQTLEHLEILSTLGLNLGLIAITKSDLVSSDWLEMVRTDIRQTVAGTFLANAPILPVSATSGLGIAPLKAKIFEIANAYQRPDRLSPFRLSVDRVFHRPGHGVVVTGSVGSGSITIDQTVQIWPGGESARIRSMQAHGQPIRDAETGMRLAINLAGVKLEDLERGAELAAPGFLVETRWLAVRLKTLDHALQPIKHRTTYRLHAGTREISAKVVLFSGSELSQGNSGLALLRTSEPVVAIHGQPFVIRTESPPSTIAGGRILAPNARLIRRTESTAWACLNHLDSPSHSARLAAWLTLNRQPVPDLTATARELGMTTDESRSALESLRADGLMVTLSNAQNRRSWEITKDHFHELLDRITRRLSRFHHDSPRLTGIPASNLSARFVDQPPDLILSVLAHPLSNKHFKTTGPMISLAGFQPQLTQAERKLRQVLLEGLIASQLTPPLLEEWSKTTGAKPGLLLDIFHILSAEGLVEEMGHGLFMLKSVADQIRDSVHDWFQTNPSMTVAELRDRIGVSRKYAVPIAEWLDLMKITRRDGDLRYAYSS